MNYNNILGYFGIFFGVIYKFPQIIKIYKNKKGDNISKRTFLLQNMTYILFIIYLSTKEEKDYLLISYDAFGLSLNCLIIGMKFYYKRTRLRNVSNNSNQTNELEITI